MREITVKFTFTDSDLEGYGDVNDELIIEDYLDNKMTDISYEIVSGEDDGNIKF